MELEEVDSLEEPVSTASLHAVVSSLSPVKKGRNSDYFEGTLTDGKSTVRLVGFKRSQQSKIKRFMDKQQPILLDDCEIKRLDVAKEWNNAEGFYYHHFLSEIFKQIMFIWNNNLFSKDEYEKVSVNIKVLNVLDSITVPTGKKTQEAIIADSSTYLLNALYYYIIIISALQYMNR